MKISERDYQLLSHIVRHCQDVHLAMQHFGEKKEDFLKDNVFLNACSMPILQVGELAKHLSDEIISRSPEIPWRQIKGMRDFFVHDYQSMDKDVIWETATKGIPDLLLKCQNIIGGKQ